MSTGKEAVPNAWLMTTDAVLGPTPGSLTISSTEAGTCPPGLGRGLGLRLGYGLSAVGCGLWAEGSREQCCNVARVGVEAARACLGSSTYQSRTGSFWLARPGFGSYQAPALRI